MTFFPPLNYTWPSIKRKSLTSIGFTPKIISRNIISVPKHQSLWSMGRRANSLIWSLVDNEIAINTEIHPNSLSWLTWGFCVVLLQANARVFTVSVMTECSEADDSMSGFGWLNIRDNFTLQGGNTLIFKAFCNEFGDTGIADSLLICLLKEFTFVNKENPVLGSI